MKVPLFATPAEVAELLRVDQGHTWAPPVCLAGWGEPVRISAAEQDGYRDGIGAMTRSLIEHGMDPGRARAKAQECANRVHVRSQNGGRF